MTDLTDGFDADFDDNDVAAPAEALATLADDFEELRRLRDEDLRLSKEAKDAHKAYLAKRGQVWERMEDEKVGAQKLKGVGHFIQNEPKWKPAIQDKRALIAWAMEHQPALVENALAKGLLNQLVHERMADGRELPPGLGAYPEKVVSIRKA